MTQLLCHLWGDYILQSDWMAQNKTKAFWPAAIHALLYSSAFLFLRPSWRAFGVILVTHLFIDRFRLARFVVAFKNAAGEWGYDWTRPGKFATSTGYPVETPAWMAVWLLIIADNILHLTINFLALRFL